MIIKQKGEGGVAENVGIIKVIDKVYASHVADMYKGLVSSCVVAVFRATNHNLLHSVSFFVLSTPFRM